MKKIYFILFICIVFIASSNAQMKNEKKDTLKLSKTTKTQQVKQPTFIKFGKGVVKKDNLKRVKTQQVKQPTIIKFGKGVVKKDNLKRVKTQKINQPTFIKFGKGVKKKDNLKRAKPQQKSSNRTTTITASIYNASWSNKVDQDGDGYYRSSRLNWDPDVVGSSGSLSVYEKIYWKLSTSSAWTLLTTTSAHTITGVVSTNYYVDITGGSHALYDFRIDLYRSGQSYPDDVYDSSDDVDLNDFKMETAAQDGDAATIFSASWSNKVDSDGDGYYRSARLNWDPDVVGSTGSLSIYEKIYWKLSTSSSWTLLATTSSHTITGTSSVNYYLDITAGNHALYDFRIDLYRTGQSSADQVYDSSDDADLNDFPMETATEDRVTATVYDAAWSNKVDSDGDGYYRSARLNWDPDVVGSTGSLSIYEKIYWKLSTSSSWTLLATTSSHTITGTSSVNYYLDITAGNHALYDFSIDIYRVGQSTADKVYDSSDDADLNDFPMETAVQDDGSLGIEDVVIEGFAFYPNPVKEILTISAKVYIKQIQIFNLLGQQIVKKNVNDNKVLLDVSGLVQGTYFAIISTDKTRKSVKFLKE